MKRYHWLGYLFAGCIFLSCDKDHLNQDRELIEQYLLDNNLTATMTPEGVYYVETLSGSGNHPVIWDEVTVHYEGFLLDGFKFDSSYDRGQPATFPLQAVIEGWQIGIPLFKEGGKGKLLIPSSLGYGKNPPQGSDIPKHAVLIFDVELLDIL